MATTTITILIAAWFAVSLLFAAGWSWSRTSASTDVTPLTNESPAYMDQLEMEGE